MKVRRTRAQDVNSPDCETRAYEVTERYDETGNGKIRLNIICPFCRCDVRAYLWSLSGGGKSCSCGAFIGSLGNAYKLK